MFLYFGLGLLSELSNPGLMIVKTQVRDWAREAGRAERSGAAHPADPGAGTLAEGDDGAALQPVHGRTRGSSFYALGYGSAAVGSNAS